MEIRNNYTAQQSFGSLKGHPKDIMKLIPGEDGMNAIKFAVIQAKNDIADIIVKGEEVTVKAREGYSLPYDLGKEFRIWSVGGRDWMHNIAEGLNENFEHKSVDVGILSGFNKFYSKNKIADAAQEIANKAYYSATGKNINPYYSKPETAEEVLGQIIDKEV